MQRRLLDCFVAGDDPRVSHGKPTPDLLLIAAEDLGLTPDVYAYVGDSKSDILAAKAAGMPAIAVPSGNRPISYYQEAGANIIVDCLGDVLSHIT